MNRQNICKCAVLLASKGLTIAFAESATAGRMAMEFSLCKEASKFLLGGIICYNARLKEDILNVPATTIKTYTPESAEVTRAITLGLKRIIKADIHIGITGLTTPGGSETPEKPVGTLFFCALMGENIIFEDRKVFAGKPESIILQSIDHLNCLLIAFLKGYKANLK